MTGNLSFRRIVLSGDNNCCIDTSNIVTVGIYDLPTGRIVSVTDTTICEGEEVILKIELTGSPGWNLSIQ